VIFCQFRPKGGKKRKKKLFSDKEKKERAFGEKGASFFKKLFEWRKSSISIGKGREKKGRRGATSFAPRGSKNKSRASTTTTYYVVRGDIVNKEDSLVSN